LRQYNLYDTLYFQVIFEELFAQCVQESSENESGVVSSLPGAHYYQNFFFLQFFSSYAVLLRGTGIP